LFGDNSAELNLEDAVLLHFRDLLMSILKAVITAGSPDQKSLPLQNLVDQEGNAKTALQLIADEAVNAGVDEICVVICPGEQSNYEKAAGEHATRLTFVEQDSPRGYGDALFRAAEFVGQQPFLHLVSDHIYLSQQQRGYAGQLIDIATAESCAVSAVQPTRENLLPYFGTVGAKRVANRTGLYEVKTVIEKPTPTQAEQELIVAGLRASHYLCLSGIHVLTSTVMEILAATINEAPSSQTIHLSPALETLARRERYLATEIDGSRFNIGVKYGLLKSQLALALSGKDRDEILTELLGLVADRPSVSVSQVAAGANN
jgi:UTP--glucose-1-phosphate uridylyltransferase